MNITKVSVEPAGIRFLMDPGSLASLGFERLLRGEPVEVIFEFRERKMRTSRTPSYPEVNPSTRWNQISGNPLPTRREHQPSRSNAVRMRV